MSRTRERKLLDEHPGLREMAESSPEFANWCAGLPRVTIDAEEFRVIGGDRLMDNDQLIVEWIRLFQPDLLGRGNG